MLLVDTADRTAIVRALTSPAVAGFTTNPTLMARAAGVPAMPITQYVSRARELCKLATDPAISGLKHLMIQGVGSDAEVLRQAEIYVADMHGATGAHLWIKLPPTKEGLRNCSALRRLGCSTIVTAVFTPAQAFMAMEAGADGVVVYLGRMMKQEQDWETTVERIARVIRSAGRTLLLASFPDRQTVDRALDYSRDVTVSPDVLDDLLGSPHSTNAMSVFDSRVLWLSV